jgi:hypothetical protein
MSRETDAPVALAPSGVSVSHPEGETRRARTGSVPDWTHELHLDRGRSGEGAQTVPKAATKSRELDAGFRVVGRLHLTWQRLPPPPVEGGSASSFQRLPPPPVEGGGAASFQRRPVASPPVSTDIEFLWRCRVRRSRCPRRLTVPVVVLVPLAPRDGHGARGRARAGRVNQARCGAVRHDCAALCHRQQRIDQRSAWRRRQRCRGPPGRAPSNPIH